MVSQVARCNFDSWRRLSWPRLLLFFVLIDLFLQFLQIIYHLPCVCCELTTALCQQLILKRGKVGLILARALLAVSLLKEANVILFLLLENWFLDRLKETLHDGGVDHWPDDGLRSD